MRIWELKRKLSQLKNLSEWVSDHEVIRWQKEREKTVGICQHGQKSKKRKFKQRKFTFKVEEKYIF